MKTQRINKSSVLLFTNHLKRIQSHGDAGRVQPREHRGGIDHAERTKEHSNRPMKANRPSKRLFIDDENQDERQKVSQREAGQVGEQSEKPSLYQDHFSYLIRRRA